MHAQVTGSDGTLSVFNPFAPHYGHRVKIETASGTRREKFSRRATYDYQLEAFAAATEDGAPFPTTASDAIRTMELIDSIYIAAGLPARQPTPPVGAAPGRDDVPGTAGDSGTPDPPGNPGTADT
jgi:predicted dehydrogenase